MDAASAIAKANKLRGSARGHKRAEAWHRRRAKEESQELARIEALCEEFGIELVIEEQAGPELATSCVPATTGGPLGEPLEHAEAREIVHDVRTDLNHTTHTQAQGGHSERSESDSQTGQSSN